MKKLLVVAGLALASLLPLAAQARVHVGVGINLGFPGYYQPYYAPPPVYYAPPPVYYYGPPAAYEEYYERPRYRRHEYREYRGPNCYWDHGYRYCN